MKRNFKRISGIILLMGAAFLLTVGTARAATLTVTAIGDGTTIGALGCQDGCILREAIKTAAPGDRIEFASPLFDSPQTITLTEAPGFRDLVIDKNLTIAGKGAHLLTIRRSSGAFRIITVAPHLTSVNLSGMTIENGFLSDNGGGIFNDESATTITACHIKGSTAGLGGGIYNELGGTLVISGSTISNNVANGISDGGGGIHNRGTLTLINSTVSGNVKNSGNSNGGGIWTGGATTITNSTVTDNEAAGTNSAGGINRVRDAVTVNNSIVAANRNYYEMPDVVGAFQSGGYNLIGNPGTTTAFNQIGDQVGQVGDGEVNPLDPYLEELALYGGSVPTHNLLARSSAIDKGRSFGAGVDQRGLPRPFVQPNLPPAAGGDHADIGALEMQAQPSVPPVASATPNPFKTNRNTPLNIMIQADDQNADPLTLAISDQPDNGVISNFTSTPNCTISDNSSSCDQTVTYTPNSNFAGTDSFSFKANDGQFDSNIFTVSIIVNAPPAAADDSYSVQLNATVLTVAAPGVLSNDTDADNNALSAVLVGNASHGTVSLDANGGFTYTPESGYTGADSFTYQASDGGSSSNVATVNITIKMPLTVTKTADTNDGACDADCSLREAIAAAVSGEVIMFASPLFDSPQTIALSQNSNFQTLLINKNLTITGKGAQLLTIRRAADATAEFRIFQIENGTIVNFSGMTITGGKIQQNGSGIAAYNNTAVTLEDCYVTENLTVNGDGAIISFGTLTLDRSAVTNNTSTNDSATAGIFHTGNGMLTVKNSTVSGNVATANSSPYAGGGGIAAFNSTVLVTNSTITDNRVSNAASGISSVGAQITVRNSIIAGNRNNSSVPDVAASNNGTFTSEGYNLVGNKGAVAAFNQTGDQTGNSTAPLNPRLESLALNGGTTPTHRPQTSPVLSPAIDKGNSFGLTTDQRGGIRPFDNNQIAPASGGDNSDIGAYEESAFPLFVTKTDDTNDGACDADCSLREAIAAAPAGGTILFDPAVFGAAQTITLSEADGFRELGINKNLIVLGTGANLLTVRRAANAAAQFRIFKIYGAAAVNLSELTIAGGDAGNALGGGIFNIESSQLTVANSHVTGNKASSGGGVFSDSSASLTLIGSTVSGNTADCVCGGGAGINSDGVLTLLNSTVSGNVKTGGDGNAAGGIYIFSGNVTLTNSTITDNQAPGENSAGGVFRAGGTVTVGNTIIAGNRSNLTIPDVFSEFISQGYNLIGNSGAATGFSQTGDIKGGSSGVIDPKLAALGNYGGATQTHKLLSDSPAIDAGSSFGAMTDQRGSVRPFDNTSIANAADGADIGAFEWQPGSILSIAGTVIYGSTPNSQAAKYVAAVGVAASGGGSVVTNGSGVYSLDNLNEGGNYTVTLSKTGNVNGISAFDATLVLRCVAAGNGCTLTDNQKLAADVNTDNSISAFDATQILRFVAANGANANTGQAGNWRFLPASRNYSSISGSYSNENYTALLIGEVNGDWTPPASNLAFENALVTLTDSSGKQ